VAEIRGQERQFGLHIGTLAVPAQEAMDGERVTNVMYAWTVTTLATAFAAYETQEARDPMLDTHAAVRPATRAPQQRGVGVGWRSCPLPLLEIRIEAGEQAGGHGDEPCLAKFPGPNVQDGSLVVDIAELQADGFANAETGRVEEEQERDIRMGAQSARQMGCSLDERANLLLRVDVGTEAGRHPWTTDRVGNEHRRIRARAKNAILTCDAEIIAACDGCAIRECGQPLIEEGTRELVGIRATLDEEAIEVVQRHAHVLMTGRQVLAKR
jgi:hypothetical protein